MLGWSKTGTLRHALRLNDLSDICRVRLSVVWCTEKFMGIEEDLRCDIRFYFDGQLRILDNIRATDMVMPWPDRSNADRH